MIDKASAIDKINQLASRREPFLLITDFKGVKNHVLTLSEIAQLDLLYSINGHSNHSDFSDISKPIKLQKDYVSFAVYKRRFEQVHQEISAGNTYLLNLTQPTPITSNVDLKTIYQQAVAKYKLWYQGEFVVFSPETFVQIKNGILSSFPMKGTIDATLPNAKPAILSNKKEMAEHAAIVDLIRNDMSIFAHNVQVERFRYVEELRTNEKHLLQVSSEITGQLPLNHLDQLGDLLYSLLPAGSISGTPKQKTLDIIGRVEGYDRDYYTGIVGYFDGESFDSGVMIRYIQDDQGQLTYKSGGGIHFLSDPEEEYQELKDKVYVPIR